MPELKNWRLALCAGVALAALAGKAQACEPDYSNVTLTAGSQTGPFIASALDLAAKKWKEQTCGTVKIVEYPFGEIYTKYLAALSSGDSTFDVLAFPPAYLPDFAAFLSEAPESMRSTAEWQDILPVYRDRLMKWDDRFVSQSMDGDVFTLTYRTDLFNDPKEKEAFQAKYGYALAAPKTWKQYYDIAEFFTRPDQNLYGTVEAMRRDGQAFWYFFSHGVPYTQYPGKPGYTFFDPTTMKPLINNPAWLRALEDYKKSVQYSPPGVLNFTYGDVNTAFAGGQTAMAIGWGDTGVIAADKTQSKVAGKVGSAVLPGSDEVWNPETQAWDKFDPPSRAPFMAFGGWQAAVPTTAKNPEAAWSFIQTLSSPEVSGQAIVTAGTGVNPYRASHLSDPKHWSALFSDEEAKEYLASQADSVNDKNVALDMRLPGYFSYTDDLSIELAKALSGQEPPQQALDAAVASWEKLTDEFGRDTQLKAYRESIGLPPLGN